MHYDETVLCYGYLVSMVDCRINTLETDFFCEIEVLHAVAYMFLRDESVGTFVYL